MFRYLNFVHTELFRSKTSHKQTYAIVADSSGNGFIFGCEMWLYNYRCASNARHLQNNKLIFRVHTLQRVHYTDNGAHKWSAANKRLTLNERPFSRFRFGNEMREVTRCTHQKNCTQLKARKHKYLNETTDLGRNLAMAACSTRNRTF